MGKKIAIIGYIKKKAIVDKGYIIIDEATGLIEQVGYGDMDEEYETCYKYDENYLIQCGDFNAHSHPEQSIYTDIVDKSWDLGTWCRNTIYKYSVNLERKHIYLGCCRAFSRMIKLGVTSVMVSFYCHNNSDNLYDKEVIRAAEDTGIRLYFGRMNYDIITEDAYEAKKDSQRCYYEDVSKAKENYISLVNEIDLPRIEIAPAIHSIHASTKEAIVSAINLGNKYKKTVQFHLSEDKGDVDLSIKLYGCRPIEFLASLVQSGEVDSLENVMLSDCIWIDDNERKLIYKHNMKVVLNPRMNNRIKAGEANLENLLKEGIIPYLGTDGEASNDDVSITGEKEFLKNRFANMDQNIIESLGKEDFRFKNGYIGDIKENNYADIKVTYKGNIEDVFIGGKLVVENGELTTIDIKNDCWY